MNLVQSGLIVLSMGILLSEADIRKAIKAGTQEKLLREFQERYSVHFASVVADVISKQITSFRELQARISGDPAQKQEHSSQEHFKISPPIDFEGDIFQSLGQASKKPDDPLAGGKGLSESKKAGALPGRLSRFLGADGQLVRRSAADPSAEEYRLADIHARINGPAKERRLHRQGSDTVERRSLDEEPQRAQPPGQASKQRDFWERDLRLEKNQPLFEKDLGVQTPVVQRKDMFGDKPFKSAVHSSVEKEASSLFRNKENSHFQQVAAQNSVEKDSRVDTKSAFASNYKPPGSDLKRVGSSTADSFYLNSFNPHAERASGNTLAKRKSAQDFYSKAQEEPQGEPRHPGKDKTTIRVSELFNKLNNRFKKYHEEFESASKQPPAEPRADFVPGKHELQASPRKELRNERRDSEHPGERTGYSPFETSNNKKKQREDREQQYSSMYLKQQPDSNPGLPYGSPRQHLAGAPLDRDPGYPAQAWRAPGKASDEKAYLYREPHRLPAEHRLKSGRFDSEEMYMDKKKNRSVSFNLSHSNQDMSRSLYRPAQAPKSILKNKLSFEEDPKEDHPAPKPYWSSHRAQNPYQETFDKIRDSALDSFMIQPKRMAEPPSDPKYKPAEDFEPYRPRSPYKVDYSRTKPSHYVAGKY